MAKKWFVLFELSFFNNDDRFSSFQAQDCRTIIVLSYIWQHWSEAPFREWLCCTITSKCTGTHHAVRARTYKDHEHLVTYTRNKSVAALPLLAFTLSGCLLEAGK